MQTLTDKYTHIVLNTQDCRWKDINLFNLSKEMSPWEAGKCLESLQPALLAAWEAKVVRLESSGCPEIILGREKKTRDKVATGKHPHLQKLFKRSKEV